MSELREGAEVAARRAGAVAGGDAVAAAVETDAAASAAGSEQKAPALDIRNLSFAYPGAAPVLRGVSLSLPAGAFALVVGATGSGKSTLLSLVKPEISPAGERTGEVRVFGRPLEELDACSSAQQIGFVFQSPENQIVCESVWHEMAFCLENLGTPQDEMRRLVAETSYFFGMEDWFRQPTATLSGGRKQLLALAGTLVAQPRLLLLDEPTAQLDPIAEKNFLHALFRVNRELGCTVVVATHRPAAMVDYASCAFELADGALRAVPDLERLRTRLPLLAAKRPGRARREGGAPAASAATATTAAAPSESVIQPAASALLVSRGAPEVATAPAAAKVSAPISAPASAAPSPSAANPAASVSAPVSSAASALLSSKASVAPVGVVLERAYFRYERDGAWVLRGLDLRVRRGSIHALVGGNGCGKSTLLALVAGIHKLQRGRLRVGSGTKALLPQDPKALFAEETVLDELLEWRRIGGYGRYEAEVMLERVGLGAARAQHPYDLSGGQQQLLALGKVLLVGPQLLLLDEPTKGLDDQARSRIARILLDLRAEGATVLVATHDLDFARQLADEVSMMFDGEIACTQGAEEFFERNVYYRP